MPRVIRYQYPGAVYHLMARGDGGKVVFENDEDRKGFLFRLGKVCECHGWRVHAWVLMDNHFHLLVETPEANLATGMKLLLGSFSQGWNRRRLRRGHVFQGRYKSIPVDASDSDPYYFRIAADYIHLNPARAGLAGGSHGRLVDYAWSSLRDHAARLVFGKTGFLKASGGVDREEGAKEKPGQWVHESHGEAEAEAEAERLVVEALAALGISSERKDLEGMRKGDQVKVLVAALLRRKTAVGNGWIAERLSMGHHGSVSRLVVVASKDTKHESELENLIKLKKLLKCVT
jgi:putative transposase